MSFTHRNRKTSLSACETDIIRKAFSMSAANAFLYDWNRISMSMMFWPDFGPT